jgi:dTDP-4-dehydrorhamnose reductase
MKIKYFIMGGYGTLGSAFVGLLKKKKQKYKIITRKNYCYYKKKKCNFFVNMNGNSSKYLANQSPKMDFYKSVNSLFKSILDFQYNKYIFISSGDVYENFKNTHEDLTINNPRNIYGKNKLISELIVKLYCKKWLIFRPATVLSLTAKKGLIYDLLNSRKVFSNPDSSYSLLTSDTLAKIIYKTKKNNQIYNISADGIVNNKKIKELLLSNSPFDKSKKKENYIIENRKIKRDIEFLLPTSINELKKLIKTTNKKKNFI